MDLKDYIAKLPIETIIKTRIYPNRIVLPAEIDKKDFYKKLKENIEQTSLTDEKAIYTVLLAKSSKGLKSIQSILLEKVKF